MDQFVDFLVVGAQHNDLEVSSFILDWVESIQKKVPRSEVDFRAKLAYLYYKANLDLLKPSPNQEISHLALKPKEFEENIAELFTEDHPSAFRNRIGTGEVLKFFPSFEFDIFTKGHFAANKYSQTENWFRVLFNPIWKENKGESPQEPKDTRSNFVEEETGLESSQDNEWNQTTILNEILSEENEEMKEKKRLFEGVDLEEDYRISEEQEMEEEASKAALSPLEESNQRKRISVTLDYLNQVHVSLTQKRVSKENKLEMGTKIKYAVEVAKKRGIEIDETTLSFVRQWEMEGNSGK